MRATLWLVALAREEDGAVMGVRAYKGGADGGSACNSGTVEGSAEWGGRAVGGSAV